MAPIPEIKDINRDGKIDDGEILSVIEIIVGDYYAESERRKSLIVNIEEQISECKKTVDKMMEDAK